MEQKINQTKSNATLWLQYCAGYGLFFVLCAGIAFILFRVRSVFIQFAFLIGYNSVIVKGISNLGVVFFAILALIAVIILEDYLRKGIQNGTMLKRVLKTAGIEIGVVLLTYIATLIYLLLFT